MQDRETLLVKIFDFMSDLIASLEGCVETEIIATSLKFWKPVYTKIAWIHAEPGRRNKNRST